MPRSKLTPRTRRSGRHPGLAILGAPPMFTERVHVGRPNIGDRRAFLSRVDDMLDRRWLTNNGPLRQGVRSTRSPTLLGVQALRRDVQRARSRWRSPSARWGCTARSSCPPITFVATAHALQWQEITPVFCRHRPATRTTSTRPRVERLITPRTTGIIGVHLWGRPCDIGRAARPSRRRHDLKLMFDAAHAFGCSHGGRMIGGFGDARGLQLPRHQVPQHLRGRRGRHQRRRAGREDAPDAQLRLRRLRQRHLPRHQRQDDRDLRGDGPDVARGASTTSSPSTSATTRPTGAACAACPGVSAAQLRRAPSGATTSTSCVEVDDGRAGAHRDELIAVLHAENVLARRYF